MLATRASLVKTQPARIRHPRAAVLLQILGSEGVSPKLNHAILAELFPRRVIDLAPALLNAGVDVLIEGMLESIRHPHLTPADAELPAVKGGGGE